MNEKPHPQIPINRNAFHRSLHMIDTDTTIKKLLWTKGYAAVISGSPYHKPMFDAGAATAFTVERAYGGWFKENETPAISLTAVGAIVGVIMKINGRIGGDIILSDGADYTNIYTEVIQVLKGNDFLAEVEGLRKGYFSALEENIFYAGACNLSLVVGFEQAARGQSWKNKLREVVYLPVLNP